MADQRFESGVLRDLVDETAAIGELAKSEEAFRAAIALFSPPTARRSKRCSRNCS